MVGPLESRQPQQKEVEIIGLPEVETALEPSKS